MAYRYAVYFVPSDDSDLYEFGARWLGRDSLGQKRPPFDIQNLTLHEWEKVISGPRKYGFHATLNPPFPLKKRFSERQFYEAVQQFSASHKHVVIGKLRLIQLGGFLALCPIKLNAGRELAADCLHEFECFRAPITDKEIPGYQMSRRICDSRKMYITATSRKVPRCFARPQDVHHRNKPHNHYTPRAE